MANNARETSNGESALSRLLSRLFSGLIGSTDIDRAKKRRMREIAKDLKKRSRFFRVKDCAALPGLAKWFYDIYRVTGPAELLLEKYSGSDLLKKTIAESALPLELQETMGELGPERIGAKIEAGANIDAAAEDIKGALNRLNAAMDGPTVKRINSMYTDLQRLEALCRFPFHFLLKKFDSGFPERDFLYSPQFGAVRAGRIKDDVMDFLEVFYALNPDADWNGIFDALKTYRDLDVVSRSAWKKVIQHRREMTKTRFLDQLIRYICEDPTWAAVPDRKTFEIAESFFAKVRNDAERAIRTARQGRNRKAVDDLLSKIFDKNATDRMMHYTDDENRRFIRKKLSGFIYVEPMSCLKAFFQDIYKGEVSQVVDLLSVRGKWVAKTSSQEFSGLHGTLLDIIDQLAEFDEDLSDQGPKGIKIARLLRLSARDRTALAPLRAIVQEVDAQAKQIITFSAQKLIALGKILHQLLNEYRAVRTDTIFNWKEIDAAAGIPLDDQLAGGYTKVYQFVQLLQLYVNKVK